MSLRNKHISYLPTVHTQWFILQCNQNIKKSFRNINTHTNVMGVYGAMCVELFFFLYIISSLQGIIAIKMFPLV